MSKKKMTPAQKAAARRERTPEELEAREAARSERALAAKRNARNLDTPRERLTKRIVTTVQVVLVIFPFALLGYSSFSGTGLEEAMRADPGFVVSFIAAMAQPLAAWILRFAYRHYADGDGGYAVGNLIGLLCAEAFLQNVVGLAGFALILWRMWGKAHGELTEWRERRGVGGVLVDISGALAVLAIGLICAFASWRLSA